MLKLRVRSEWLWRRAQGIHASLGKASLLQPSSTSAFIGLSTLHRLGQLSGASDRAPVSTSGDGSLALMSQDVLITTARETGTIQQFQPNQGYLSGVTPLSYIAGALSTVNDPAGKTNVLIGTFGGSRVSSPLLPKKGILYPCSQCSLAAQAASWPLLVSR